VAVYLVCEAFRQGLDERVLRTLVIQFHNLNVLIEPACGSKGHGAVRNYLESRGAHDTAITVEDRDYRGQAVARATWANQAGKSFVWRRHEIENYLLHPRAVLELFKGFRAAGASWANALPGTEADVSAWLQMLASPLLEEHAAEVLKHEVVQQINGCGSLSFGPGRPILPGAHTCGQAQWVPALQQEAIRLCQTCSTVATLPALQPAAIPARYLANLADFQNPAFLTSGDFLTEMKGKALLAAFSRHLVGLGAPTALDSNGLANELLHVLERIYQPNSLYQPDDFLELATILQRY
jgi:hypothetical protein